MKIDYAARARALIGTPFRPQGRGVGGLDCVGVAVSVYGLPVDCVRTDYRLRSDHEAEARRFLARHFRAIAPRELRSGDLMLLRVASDQLHFGVRTAKGFVHAHAALRRVVESPGLPQWPLIRAYRKRRG